jgi:predicted RND superfamily exporter protein
MLGRPYFQTELTRMQFQEILISTIISILLISIIMILIFKRWQSIFVALSSLGIGLIVFLGILALFGRELSLMSALYPVLMLIVGTSDVVHIMSKYFDELRKGKLKKEALKRTIKQIGFATLLTSLTTAAGFLTLLSSRIIPIREFGVNSAIGVVVAYIVVIGFTCPMLTMFSKKQLITEDGAKDNWSRLLMASNKWTINYGKQILVGAIVFLVVCVIGISKIHTNYSIDSTLPRGAKITEDFKYFEKEYSGFRPLELAVYVDSSYDVLDYEVVEAIHRTETFVKSQDEIQSAFSLATLVKSINQMTHSNQPEYYAFPDAEEYRKHKKYLKKLPGQNLNLLINEDRSMSRISTRVKDVGSENIKDMGQRINRWIEENIDSTIVNFRQTGTGVILDKNSEFIRQSLTTGLGIALLMISLIMGIYFRRFKMLFLALIPNIVPLLFAAAILGYFNIPLEAGISIVFAIIFGIAVDDTIHFLSKYKMAKNEFGDTEQALSVTFQESGKAIIFTSIILFFGFLVLLFSKNGPSVIIGTLISVTLVSAVIADLLLLPVLIRKFKL